eukprot:IDg5790t1
MVVAGDGKQLWLDIKNELKRCFVDKVRPYVASADVQTAEPDRPHPEVLNSKERRSMDSVFDRLITGEKFMCSVKDRMSKLRASTEGNTEVPETPAPIFITERVSATDPRATSALFTAAKRTEVDGLVSRHVWTVVNRNSLPVGANIIGARFDLTLKNAGTDREKAKARFVGQGFRDKLKDFIVHSSPTLRQSSTKIILSVS